MVSIIQASLNSLLKHAGLNYCICSVNCILLVFEHKDAVEWFEKILSVVSPDASQVLQQIFLHS